MTPTRFRANPRTFNSFQHATHGDSYQTSDRLDEIYDVGQSNVIGIFCVQPLELSNPESNSALQSEKIRQAPAGPGFWRASDPRVEHRASRSYDPEAQVPWPRQYDVALVGYL